MRTGLITAILTLLLTLGHSAFAAPSQDARSGFKHFRLLEEPVPLPERAVTTAAGEKVVPAKRDGLILINIWATWCAPCVEELPSLDALQGALGDGRFEVMAVSTDRGGMKAVRPFFKKLEIRHLNAYLDPESEFALALKANALPVSVLVKDGTIIGKAVGPEDWSSAAAKKLIRDHL